MGPLALKRDERFSYGDYLTWNDDQRWELIDGVPYGMSPAPGVAHQRTVGALHFQLYSFLRNNPCQLFVAPFDVRLPEVDESDDLVETVVQPDLLVICDREKLDKAGCRGAPDLVVEVLSPGTAQKDQKIKFHRYERAGVREYWIVDPAAKSVMLFFLGSNGRYGHPTVANGGERLTAGIFPGLEIDLTELFAEPD